MVSHIIDTNDKKKCMKTRDYKNRLETLLCKNTMFIRHQTLWTIRVIKNTSLRSIRRVYTEWKKPKKNFTLESKSTTVSLCCDHIPRVEHIDPHTCEFDLVFSLRRSVGLAPHMEIKETEQGLCTQGQFEIKIVISLYPNIVSKWVIKKCDPLPDLKPAARAHLHCKQSSWAVLVCYWHTVLNSSKPKHDAPF